MKRFLKMVSLVMVIAVLMAVPAYAQESAERSSSYFSSYRAYCTKVSSTKIGIVYQVLALGEMDELGASTIKVQYSSDKKNWTTAKTFTKANYSSMIETDAATFASALECTVPSGYYYRAYVAFYAKNGSGTGYKYYYTAII
jgi:hypothetical protein